MFTLPIKREIRQFTSWSCSDGKEMYGGRQKKRDVDVLVAVAVVAS